MRVFGEALARHAVPMDGRRWVYVPYDQLTAEVGLLATLTPRESGIVLVEAPAKAARRPYHRQKLALVLSNQRHFAIEQAKRGVAVRYLIAEAGYREALESVLPETGPLTMMEAAERELRTELAPLVARGALEVAPHAGWLTTRDEFIAGAGARAPWRLDAFYAHVRRCRGILMDGARPVGGKWSFDAENRRPWRGSPPAPTPPVFTPDAITREVGALIESRFASHPGTLDLAALPASATDAAALWQWARKECLPSFGPFEDAMSRASSGLFHTRIAPLLNLQRLSASRIVRDVADDETLDLPSREGFVRQILGWRELVRHVHHETDGFRILPDGVPPIAELAGDGGFGSWRGSPWPRGAAAGDGGACPSALEADEPLPGAFWGDSSGLACLDNVVRDVWREGWSHHITRLMVLSNLATLLGVRPRELCDWFWVAYIDAYDWVVEPNVLAMGTYGVGSVMTTKPYVSGAAYINKMSDHCSSCAFDPKKNCPITRMYWAFLGRHEDRFAQNPRTAGPVASLRRRAPGDRKEDERVLSLVRRILGNGGVLSPGTLGVKTD